MRVLPLAAVSLLIVAPAAVAESLGEAAAREAARRQQGSAKKAPVYTQGELSRPAGGGTYNPMTGPVVKEAPKTRTSAPPGLVLPILHEAEGDGEDTAARLGGHTEAEWRQAAASLHAQIRTVTEEVKALEQNSGGMAERKLVCPAGNPQCWNPKAESSSPGSRLMAARRRLAALQQALSTLEDMARQSSVPPGWLRER
jgi:hypothetical protein